MSLRQQKICAIVPTYNNQGTLLQVLDRLQAYADDIIVVNDGSTDGTETLLQQYADSERVHSGIRLTLCSYQPNQGKGHALRTGFRKAVELGFDYAVTIDSDGQHYPEEIPALVKALEEQSHPAIIVGQRTLPKELMSGGSVFANRFSNFWFALQTWQYLPDTQTGFRLYPLHHLHGLSLITARYEAELELLVLAAWHGVRLVSAPVRVYYPPREERVSHFRPFWDFFRITILNTVLCILCFCYGWWSILIHRLCRD